VLIFNAMVHSSAFWVCASSRNLRSLAAALRNVLWDLTNWIEAGKLVQAADVQQGFDSAPKTFLRLFSGANLGKQLLQIADPALDVPG
jgi:hypothetical protein